jgi:glycine/D-amino acid oxidase-like deaminating enzyme
VNITIVGAGIVGCAVAHELASRGACVHVVDMRGAGMGATQASAGILAPYIEGHLDALLRLGVCSLSLYDAFIEQVTADARQAIEYERSGSLQVALDVDETARLSRRTPASAARLRARRGADGRACRRRGQSRDHDDDGDGRANRVARHPRQRSHRDDGGGIHRRRRGDHCGG